VEEDEDYGGLVRVGRERGAGQGSPQRRGGEPAAGDLGWNADWWKIGERGITASSLRLLNLRHPWCTSISRMVHHAAMHPTRLFVLQAATQAFDPGQHVDCGKPQRYCLASGDCQNRNV